MAELTKPQFAEHLREKREKYGLSKYQMAIYLEVDYGLYCRYERGDTMPRAKTLERVVALVDNMTEEAIKSGQTETPVARESFTELRERADSSIPCIDDRTFEQQMADLGVEVVSGKKPNSSEQGKKLEIKWFAPNRGSSSHRDDQVKVLSQFISFGDKPYRHLLAKSQDSKKLKVRIGMTTYEGRKCLYIKPVQAGGYKLSVYAKYDSNRAGSKALIKLILDAGLPKGRYDTVLVRGGVIAVPEGVE